MNRKVLLWLSLACLLFLILHNDPIVTIGRRNLGVVKIYHTMLAHDKERFLISRTGLGLALGDRSIRRILAQLYIRDGQFNAAVDVLLNDSQVCTNVLECFYLGEALFGAGQRKEAFHLWRNLENIDIYFALKGDMIYKQGKKNEARQYYALSWEISSSPTKQKRAMLLNLCRDARADGEWQVAIEWCRKAVDASRDYWTLVELGRTLFEAADYHSAEEVLVEAKAFNPTLGAAYQYLGLTQQRLNKKRESVEALATSVRLMPDSIWPRIAFADVWVAYGCYEQAITEYAKALELTKGGALYEVIEAKKYRIEKMISPSHLSDDVCRLD